MTFVLRQFSGASVGLVASYKGRSSKTKGVLCSKGKRADMEMSYIKPIEHCQQKVCISPLFLGKSKS